MLISLGVLGLAAVAQTVIFVLSGSVALLADLIHNFGDALTAVPLGIAFLMRSERAERTAGLFVVAAIFISACVAGVEAVLRLIHQTLRRTCGCSRPPAPSATWELHRREGPHARRPPADSPALIADGNHAAADAYVSLAVIASAIVVAIGAADRRSASSAWPSPWSSCASPGRAGTPCAATTTTTGRSPMPRDHDSTGHDHGHGGHAHGVSADADRGKLAIALGLILAFMASEVTAGIISHSLALLADAAYVSEG